MLRELENSCYPHFFRITYTIIKKYYPFEPVIYKYTIFNRYYTGEQLGNYHQKRVRICYQYFVATENGYLTSMVRSTTRIFPDSTGDSQSLLRHSKVVDVQLSRTLPTVFWGRHPICSDHTIQKKFKAFKYIIRLQTLNDLNILIGMLGFYASWIPFYEARVMSIHNLLKHDPDKSNPQKGASAAIGDRRIS